MLRNIIADMEEKRARERSKQVPLWFGESETELKRLIIEAEEREDYMIAWELRRMLIWCKKRSLVEEK